MVIQANAEHQADAADPNTIDSTDAGDGAASAADSRQPNDRQMSRWLRKSIFVLLLAGGIIGFLQLKYDLLNRLAVRFLGPPQVELHETYADQETTSPFDHSTFDKLLHDHVDDNGWVDYAAIKASEDQLNAYLQSIANAEINGLGRDDRLAFLINTYNAFTLKLIVEYYPLDSIKDIPADQRWDAVRWNLAGQTVSLSQIEHELIRPNFVEPRIHFALVCAAIGCPPLRDEAYIGSNLKSQLASQTTYVHGHTTWFQFNDDSGELQLTQLYNWYGDDFVQATGSVLKFAAEYSDDLKQALEQGNAATIGWLDYDWTLNDRLKKTAR